MPDLSMSFINPRLLDDVSFHPCVRLKRWESEKVLSFVPPDGSFVLMSYHISTQKLVYEARDEGVVHMTKIYCLLLTLYIFNEGLLPSSFFSNIQSDTR